MREFYQLKRNLLFVMLALTGFVFVSVWLAYSLPIALNYVIGACGGLAYFRMLARDVETIGAEKRRLSYGRFAILIGLIVVASQWQNLHIVPVFLGFLTYKAAIIAYVVQTSLLPSSR